MSPPNLSIILIMICFWVTLWLVHRFLILPIGRVLDDRGQRIDSAEAAWESKNEEYLSATSRLEKEMEEAAREAATIRADHIHGAQEKRQECLSEARERADERLQKALGELDTEATSAREELRSSARKLAALLAGKLLEREVQS